MTDLFLLLSKLVTPKGEILVPGLSELVAPLTEEEKNRYHVLDYSVSVCALLLYCGFCTHPMLDIGRGILGWRPSGAIGRQGDSADGSNAVSFVIDSWCRRCILCSGCKDRHCAYLPICHLYAAL